MLLVICFQHLRRCLEGNTLENSRGSVVPTVLYCIDAIDSQRHKTALPHIKFLCSQFAGNCCAEGFAQFLLKASSGLQFFPSSNLKSEAVLVFF